MKSRYQDIYNRLISTRPTRQKQSCDGLETHHILPRSLGGTDDPKNLIVLTAREHWIAHRLLARCYTGQRRAKMIYALIRLSGGTSHRIPARIYAQLRQEHGSLIAEQNRTLWQDPNYVRQQEQSRSRVYARRKQPGQYREQWIESIRQAKKQLGDRTAQHSRSVWASLTPEQRAERGRRIAEGKRRGWAKRGEAYRQQWRERLRQGHAQIPPHIKKQQIERMLQSKYGK